MERTGKPINFELQMRSGAPRDNWPAPNRTGDMLEETWPSSSATACSLDPALNPFPAPAPPPPASQHCSNSLLERVHQLGRGAQLAVPGPLPSGSIKNCFHDYSAYARLLGGCFYCTDPLSGLAISSLPASKNYLP